MRLLIAGGGTGGHLFPGIAVAAEFLGRDPANEVLFVGTEAGIEARVLPQHGYRLATISASGIRGKGSLARLRGMAMFLYAYAQSRKILKEFRPELVLGVGGYASGPTVMAARGMLIRRFIHEQNAIPGMTNKLLARFSEKVFISLEEARQYFPAATTILTGNPVRQEILAMAAAAPAGAEGGLRLLVFGGSRGARRINQAMTEALPHLAGLAGRLTITHQTGTDDLDWVQETYRKGSVPAQVVPFIDDMAAAYRDADLVVCRAGATTIAEVTACGTAGIFIPYPHAVDDHQRRNAEALLKEGAGFMLLEQELTGESLARLVGELLGDLGRLRETGANARRLARPEAAKMIVDEMVNTRD